MHDYSLIAVLRILHPWRKPLLGVTLAAAFLSVVITLLLPNYYRATTIFYAASQDLFKPQKVFGYSQNEMYYYGGVEDIQRLITAATSQQITEYLIGEFDLYTHYRITPGSNRSQHKIQERLFDHYQITRTKYDALELSIEDTDPALAAAMANGARNKLNEVLTSIIRGSQGDLIRSYQIALAAKETALKAIEDSLNMVQGVYGIYDPEAQAEFLSTLVTNVDAKLARDRGALQSYELSRSRPGILDSIINLKASIAGLEMQRRLLSGGDSLLQSAYSLNRFIEGKGRVEFYIDAHQKAVNALNVDREILKQMEAAVALDVTALHMIEEASIPIVKERPKRSLIVIAVTVIAFVLSIFCILLIESLKGQDWSFLRW